MAVKNKRNRNHQQTNGARANGGDGNSHNMNPAAAAIEPSSLRLFGEAKEKINGLYGKLHKCVTKATDFCSNPSLDKEVLEKFDRDCLQRLNRSIDEVRGILSRDHMKVAFFGHTSNGKSTVINAILHDDVLPRGYGVTTGCFLQIQGAPQDEAYVLIQKKGQPEEKKPISYVTQMANALNPGSHDYSTLLKIYWPISKCSLLKYDVVFVDSPGVDVDPNWDKWIDDHCEDADVFVLVSSAESTLNIAEKDFFRKVKAKLSNPNIFILNNRFDIIDQNEPDLMDQVREQHVDRAVDFLSQELGISTPSEAKERTFFVSAKETLSDRCPQAAGSGGSVLKTLRGYKQRQDEFKNFERRFEESLSKSAVKTKFENHCKEGREKINKLDAILNEARKLVADVGAEKNETLRERLERLEWIKRLFYKNEADLQKYIVAKKNSIQIDAETELDNEIQRLAHIVEEFNPKNLEFDTHPATIQHYKEQLYAFVEVRLSKNLRAGVREVINEHIGPFKKRICHMSSSLPDDRQEAVKNFVASQIHIQDDLFDLKIYKRFYTEFQEDLEFRFSLGLFSIIRKFQTRFTSPKQPKNSSANQPRNDSLGTSVNADADFVSMFERLIMVPPQSPTTVGSLAVGGILVRTVGWKVIVITTLVYGTLYAYEYLTWTNSAKKRAFKAQYVRYARKGLQHCPTIISQHIANSVEQKMTTSFSKLKEEVDVESAKVSEQVNLLRSSLECLKICDDFTRELLGDSEVLMNEFAAFAAAFLS